MYVSTPKDLNIKMDMTFNRTGQLNVTQEENLVIKGEQRTVKHVFPALRVFELGGHFLYITESEEDRLYQCRDCRLFSVIHAGHSETMLVEFEEWFYGRALVEPCQATP